jgi:hypothetical protein
MNIPIKRNVTVILIPRMFEFKNKIKPILKISIPIILILNKVDGFNDVVSE